MTTKKKAFLISGGEFKNKGAEAMLYITIAELHRRFPDSDIYIGLVGEPEYIDNIRADFVFIGRQAVRYAAGGIRTVELSIREQLKKILRKKRYGIENLAHRLEGIDAWFDISGYSLSSAWPARNSVDYLERLALANKFGIPYYILPQSFGPFKYKRGGSAVKRLAARVLPTARIIFCREPKSKALLTSLVSLDNTRLSHDMVLGNAGISEAEIFKKNICRTPHINKDSVGIIPSTKILAHSESKENVYEIYSRIIQHVLLKTTATIYILHHAHADINICQQLYEPFSENDRVILLEQEFNCIELGLLMKDLNFLIASRYHAIVHAYKAFVPCVVIGWAEKYQALLSCVGQEKYHFDVRNGLSREDIMDAITYISENRAQESEAIRSHVEAIQKNNPFNIIEEDLNDA